MSQQVIPYTVPPEPGLWRSVIKALLVHLALLAFLWIGVSWQSLTPTTVEAEIWEAKPRDAAPPPPPEPEPLPEPPKPVPESKPPAPVVTPEPPKTKAADPDIALEQEKKRKKEEAKLAEEKQKREDEEKKKLAEEQKREKEEQALKEKKKLEEEQKRKQEALAAEEQKRKQEPVAEKPKRQRSSEDIDRILGHAGDGEAGTAEQKSGAPGSVCERFIGETVKSNTSFRDITGSPVVTVQIKLNANRMLEEIRLIGPSDNPAFDRQVERGIRKSGQFPAECPLTIRYLHALKP